MEERRRGERGVQPGEGGHRPCKSGDGEPQERGIAALPVPESRGQQPGKQRRGAEHEKGRDLSRVAGLVKRASRRSLRDHHARQPLADLRHRYDSYVQEVPAGLQAQRRHGVDQRRRPISGARIPVARVARMSIAVKIKIQSPRAVSQQIKRVRDPSLLRGEVEGEPVPADLDVAGTRQIPVVRKPHRLPRRILRRGRARIVEHEFTLLQDVHRKLSVSAVNGKRENKRRGARNGFHRINPRRLPSNTASVFECTASLR